jgi:transposase-like protein
MAKKYSNELILSIVKQAEKGATGSELSREHGISKDVINLWRRKFKGMDLAMMEERKRLILENIANKIRQAVVVESVEKRKARLLRLHQRRILYFSLLPQAVQEAVESWKALKTNKEVESRLRIVHALANAWGGECLSIKYTKQVASMLFRCAKGHIFETNTQRLLYGNFCTVCNKVKPEGLMKLQEAASARGWQSLATEYKDCKTPVAWHCDQGHEVKASLESIKNGMGCVQCYKNRRWYTLEKMQAIAKLRGGLCLSDQYTTYEPMLWQCKRGHVWKAIPNSIVCGSWCGACVYIGRITSPNSKAWKKYPEAL